MAIGMTYDQYWYGDVWMVEAFREADKLRREQKNREAWLQGAYVYDAISRLTPVLHAFAKKGTKPLPYPNKPYTIGGNKVETEPPATEQARENERLRATVFFTNWAKSTAKQLKEKKP